MGAYVTFLILCITSTYYGVEGFRQNNFYGEDIHTESEIFYDTPTMSSYIECVNIYKQPAFDHPMLKNHTIQMEPSFKMKRGIRSILKYDKNETLGFLKEKGCLNGSVPIQRRKGGMIKPLRLDDPGQHHYAVMNAKSKIFRGATATMQINQPSVVQPYQYSGSFVWLSSGSEEYTELSGGWMVNPKLYGDNKVRLTVSWSDDLLNGCYNTLCSGFVQINQKLHLGSIFSSVSSPEEQFEFKLSIGQDVLSGNWWLVYGVQNIGYWPKESFPKLNNGVTSLSFGGVTYAPEGLRSPPMGRGTFPTYDSKTSSTFQNIQTVDENYRVVDIDGSNCEFFMDRPYCYVIGDNEFVGPVLFYGGPGGDCREEDS